MVLLQRTPHLSINIVRPNALKQHCDADSTPIQEQLIHAPDMGVAIITPHAPRVSALLLISKVKSQLPDPYPSVVPSCFNNCLIFHCEEAPSFIKNILWETLFFKGKEDKRENYDVFLANTGKNHCSCLSPAIPRPRDNGQRTAALTRSGRGEAHTVAGQALQITAQHTGRTSAHRNGFCWIP